MKKPVDEAIRQLATAVVENEFLFNSAVENVREQIIIESLKKSVSSAACARTLGINRTTLVEMCKRYDIDPDHFLVGHQVKAPDPRLSAKGPGLAITAKALGAWTSFQQLEIYDEKLKKWKEASRIPFGAQARFRQVEE